MVDKVSVNVISFACLVGCYVVIVPSIPTLKYSGISVPLVHLQIRKCRSYIFDALYVSPRNRRLASDSPFAIIVPFSSFQ